MKLHIEGKTGPVTAVITYQGKQYRKTSEIMYLGKYDGTPVGDMWISNEIRVFFQRSDGTIIAKVRDHGEEYTLKPANATK